MTFSSLTASGFELGHANGGSRYLGGALDDVRVYSRALTQDEITRLYGLGATTRVGVTQPSVADGLVAHWTFDGPYLNMASPSGEVLDSSGNGRDMDWRNHATTTARGAVGQALLFDGVDDFGTTTTSLGSAQSVAFWVNFSTTTTSEAIVNLVGTTRIETNSSGNVVCTGCSGSTIYVDGSSASANIPRAGEWHHVGVTFSSLTASGFELGHANGGSRYLGGALDDVRVYDRVLSPAEIKRRYELGK